MSDKYLVVGATGSIGSNLAEQLSASDKEVHLVGRNDNQTQSLAEKLNCNFTMFSTLSIISSHIFLIVILDPIANKFILFTLFPKI